jgi:anti-anti-sigma factor
MTWLCFPPNSRFSSGSPARANPPLVIEVKVSQEEATVVITGELDLTSRPILADHLAAVLATRPRRLVLDMSGTAFMDCGSARLIADAGRFLPKGRRLIIRRPSAPVRRVLGLTGVDARCQLEEER